jgi:hypothetical protein
MPPGDDLNNVVQLLYEAIINEVSFKAAEDRSAESAAKVTRLTDEEWSKRINSQERARREGERIGAAMTRDEQQQLQNRINLNARQRQESAAIYAAMQKDEQRRLADRNRIEKEASDERIRQERYETQAREALQRQRSSNLIRIAREEERAAAAANRVGGGAQANAGGLFGPGSNFALRRTIIEAGAVTGTGPLAGVASLAIYGPQIALLAGIIAEVGIAVKTVKDAMADTKAELQYAAAIRTIGVSFDQSLTSAQSFHEQLIVNREESFKVAAAFARLGTEVNTRQSDIKAIGTIATAKGQTPEEVAKVLEAIGKGNRDIFETETGLKAQIVIDEYARSIGKLPAQLTKAQEAQALYNKYLEQANHLEDLANKRRESAEGRWERFKNNLSDVSSGFGRALLGSPSGLSSIFSGNLNTEDFEPLARALGYNVPTRFEGAKAGAGSEQDRQRDLERQYETAQKEGERRLKGLSVARPGETAETRLRELIRFRSEFQSLISGLDQADPRITKITDDIETRFSQSIGTAANQVEALAKSIHGSLGEFAALEAQGDKNPFIKLLVDSEERARIAGERFRLFGDEVVGQYNRMAKAADESAQYDLRVASAMKVVGLEFEAADLKKPFTELTGEMKRTLSVLQAEVGAAVRAPGLLAQATAIDLFSRFQTPRANERSFGLFDVSETSQTFAQGQEYDRLRRLGRTYGLGEGRGGEESRHIIDLEMIRLFGQLDPRLKGQILQGQRRGEFSDVFGGAFRREAAYSESGVERAVQTAEVGRRAVNLAQAKLADLDRLRTQPGADRDRTRAEYLAITGALPREELTPTLLKGRIDALKEEAVYQKGAEARAAQAVKDAKAFQDSLVGRDGKGGALGEIRKAIYDRNEQVTLRVLDEDNVARVSSLGQGYQQQ